MPDKIVTVYDVARELNINPSTVSRALQGSRLVSEKTKKAVLAKAQAMGYKKNLVASQLRSQLSNIIALVVVQKDWNWFTCRLANGVQDAASKLGYEVVVMSMGEHHNNCTLLCEQMRFAGVIVASTEIGFTREYDSDAIPTVYINRLDAEKNQVLPDDEYGIFCAMDYLAECGHSKIAYIDGPATSLHSQIRRQAYMDSMSKYGFTVEPEWVAAADWKLEKAYAVSLRMLSSQNRPTAILGADDNMCCGIYRAAHELRLRIGTDLSVVGYDNADSAIELTPGLTTFSFPLYEMGKEAIHMIDCLVRKEPFEDRVRIRGELVKRDSVGIIGH